LRRIAGAQEFEASLSNILRHHQKKKRKRRRRRKRKEKEGSGERRMEGRQKEE
jgi:hypothetical protein